MTAKVQCPFCFESFRITLYIEDGEFQEQIYDCEVCCNPIDIQASFNPDNEKFSINAEKSSGF